MTREGALAEFEKYARLVGSPPDELAPYDLVSVRVRVEPVLDLTRAEVRAGFGVEIGVLTGDRAEDLEACRSLADLARQQGYCAILSPSAALPGSTNLDLYIDGPAGNYHLEHGSDRFPINY
ncbi:MAG: hypothetical protein M3483_07210 [Gemmatimonadota bacterium]|nr:hypothetical protein [Gemmatimonadota bacterium]MDQ3606483.1 hypothetical protein [Gemmatimonadota bacterium]